MKRKILVSVLVTIFAWSICDVGDAYADLDDIPSDEEMVLLGVGVAAVVSLIIVVAINAGGDEKVEEKAREDTPVPRTEPAGRAQLRIDPVLTLQKDAVGAGLSFSF